VLARDFDLQHFADVGVGEQVGRGGGDLFAVGAAFFAALPLVGDEVDRGRALPAARFRLGREHLFVFGGPFDRRFAFVRDGGADLGGERRGDRGFAGFVLARDFDLQHFADVGVGEQVGRGGGDLFAVGAAF